MTQDDLKDEYRVDPTERTFGLSTVCMYYITVQTNRQIQLKDELSLFEELCAPRITLLSPAGQGKFSGNRPFSTKRLWNSDNNGTPCTSFCFMHKNTNPPGGSLTRDTHRHRNSILRERAAGRVIDKQ